MSRILLILFLLFAAALPLSAADPSEQFLSAYQNFQQGENLERSGNTSEAISKYRFAESLLLAISKNDPSWQKPVIEYRLKKTRENLERLQGASSSAGAAPDTGIAPTPIESHSPPIPTPSESREGPSITIVPPSKTQSEVPSSALTSASSAEIRRLRKMVETFKSQLGEAQDALSAEKQRTSDLESAEWVKKRSELVNELDVAKRKNSDLEHDLKSRDSWGKDLKDLQKQLDAAVADKLVAEEQSQEHFKKTTEENVLLMKQLQEAKNQIIATVSSNQKIEQLSQEVEKGKEAFKQLQAKLEHSEQVSKESLSKNEEIQKQLSKTSDQLSILQKQNVQLIPLREKIKQLQTSVDQGSVAIRHTSDLQADIQVLEEDRNRLREKVAQLAIAATSASKVKEMTSEKERLQKTVAELQETLNVSEKELAKARTEVATSLKVAERSSVAASAEAQKKEKDSKTAADLLTQQNNALQEQLKMALGQISTSVNHLPESEVLQEQIKKLQEQVDLNAKNYAESQHQLTELAKTQPDQAKALEEKTEALANAQGEADALKSKLTEVTAQISTLQKQGELGQARLKELQDQLIERDTKIANLKTSNESVTDKRMLEENTLLRGIVLRELKDEAKRAQAHRLMEEELKRLNVQSDTLQTTMTQLAMPTLELTPQERSLFKDAQLVISEQGDSNLQVSIFAPMSSATNAQATNAQATNAQATNAADSGIPWDGKFKKLLTQAKEEFDRQDFLQAENTFQEALKFSPNDYFALSNLGVVQFQLGKMKEAEASLKKASEQSSDSSFALTTLGIVHYRQERLQDAEKVLRKSVAINDLDFTAHNYLGIVLAASGKGKAGEDQIMRSIEINPNYADAHFNLAVIYATGKPPAKMMARKHYNKALELGSPPDPSLEHLIQ
jgi:Flp pilus assembly protein TadD